MDKIANAMARCSWALVNTIHGISTKPDPMYAADSRKIAVYEMGPNWGFIQINCGTNQWKYVTINNTRFTNKDHDIPKCFHKYTNSQRIIYKDNKFYNSANGNPMLREYAYSNATALIYGELKENYKVIVKNGTVIIPPFDVKGFKLANVADKHSYFGQLQDYVIMNSSEIKYNCKNYHYPPAFYNAQVDEKAETLTVDGIAFKLPNIAKRRTFMVYKCDNTYVLHTDEPYWYADGNNVYQCDAEILIRCEDVEQKPSLYTIRDVKISATN